MMRLRLGVIFLDLIVLDGGLLLSWCLLLAAADSVSAADRTISAVVGDEAILPCNAQRFQPLEVVEWSRPGTDTEFVLIFKTQNPDLEVPKKSYEGRVELKDSGKGDMSLVLKNVRDEDGGTYQCYVLREGRRRKRAKLQPISTVHLKVAPGGGHLGVSVGVPLAVLVVLAAVFAWKKKPFHPPSSYSEAVETAEVRLNVEDDSSPTSDSSPFLDECNPAIRNPHPADAGPKPGEMGRVMCEEGHSTNEVTETLFHQK
ncbi:uncharacterized protein LOC105923553 [Fundulus heteroclitus]|uniref:uncharacterized protein LOC105923553 n=1 Tax=Fundulus heteroclitus TaxID=8078 RepID=UPI00165A89D5|nr:uncharacterized protein LOC105923553 [Fundulus heteroclitus]